MANLRRTGEKALLLGPRGCKIKQYAWPHLPLSVCVWVCVRARQSACRSTGTGLEPGVPCCPIVVQGHTPCQLCPPFTIPASLPLCPCLVMYCTLSRLSFLRTSHDTSSLARPSPLPHTCFLILFSSLSWLPKRAKSLQGRHMHLHLYFLPICLLCLNLSECLGDRLWAFPHP